MKVMTCNDCEQKTHVLLVLDVSKSMDNCRDEAIASFNKQIQTLREKEKDLGKTDVSIVYFGFNSSESVRVVQRAISPHFVNMLTRDTYKPEGWTPMRDGIGLALELGQSLDTKGANEAFLVIVVTDGEENTSQKWTAFALESKIRELRNTGRWTFQVLGANIDFSKVSDFGIDRKEYADFDVRNFGVASNNLALGVEKYATSRSAGVLATKGLNVPNSK